MSIDFGLTEDQTLIVQTVRDFAAAELSPRARDVERARTVPDSLRECFGAVGLDRACLPEAFGGFEADLRTRTLIAEHLAEGDAGATVALQGWEAFAIGLETLCDDATQRQELLSIAANEEGDRAGSVGHAVAFSEPVTATAPNGGLATRFRDEGDEVVISGSKAFVFNAAVAGQILVLAQAEGAKDWNDLAVFMVSVSADNLELLDGGLTMGLLAAPVSTIALNDVRVPGDRRLRCADLASGLQAFTARAGLLNAARCVGVMQRAWTYARDYAVDRVAFGKPIAHFQAIAFMLSDMAMLTDASRCAVRFAAYHIDVGSKTGIRDALAAIGTAYESVIDVTQDAVQILGGAGFIEDYPAEKWLRDARTLTLLYTASEASSRALGYAFLRTSERASLDELVPLSSVQPVFT